MDRFNVYGISKEADTCFLGPRDGVSVIRNKLLDTCYLLLCAVEDMAILFNPSGDDLLIHPITSEIQVVLVFFCHSALSDLWNSNKHDTAKFCFNVGPASATLAQH